jgi:crossover junction endodeoxyribonuclease RuvC
VYVASGCIRTGAGELHERLQIVYRGVREVIQTYGPVTMGIEKVFMGKNADSALKLGQARGAAIVAGAEEGLEIAEYTATQVKQAVVRHGGRRIKSRCMMMVMHMLKLTSKPQIDASDALAIAIVPRPYAFQPAAPWPWARRAVVAGACVSDRASAQFLYGAGLVSLSH